MMQRCHLALLAYLASSHVDEPPAVSRVNHAAVIRRLDSSIRISTSTHSISGHESENVVVEWQGLPQNLSSAWVGLYLVHDDPTEVVPLKFGLCNASKDTVAGLGGTGRLFFRVLNYRDDYVFRLFSGWDTPMLVAESGVVREHRRNSPTGIRLSFTGVQGDLAVTWTSARLPHGADPRVEFRTWSDSEHDGGIWQWRAASSGTFLRSELCGAPANAEGYRDPGTFYTAVMDDLPSGAVVQYRVGSVVAWSRFITFKVPRMSGPEVRILAFGDLGQDPGDRSMQANSLPWYTGQFAKGDPGAANTTRWLLRDHQSHTADFVLHNGDLSYAMGYSAEWESFHDNIEPLSSQVPWMITVGNHERDWPHSGSAAGDQDSLGECGVPALRRFPAAPYASTRLPPNDEPWYALRVGSVLLVAMSTEHDLGPGSPQHSFVARTLQKVDRTTTPWVVAAGHRPYHISTTWDPDEAFAKVFRAAIGDLLEQEVDLLLGAHHHSYQRTCAFRQGECNASGAVVVNLGMGGARLSQAARTMPPLFRYVDDRHFGYCRITANETALSVEFVRSDDGRVHDSFVARKAAASEDAGTPRAV